jgi:hypothetical protein
MATTTFDFIGAYNGYIPSATHQVYGFMRKASEFAYNRYVKLVPVKQMFGFYTIVGRDSAVRITNDGQFDFPDGATRPSGQFNQTPFLELDYRCIRKSYPWTLGYLAIQQANLIAPKVVHMAQAISQCMTNRTNRAIGVLQNTANWGNHYGAAGDINGTGANWTTANDDPADTTNFLAIYRTLMASFIQVNLDTNAVVKQDRLRNVIAPGGAFTLSKTAEITNYVRQGPYAEEVVKKGLDPQYDSFGAPKHYRGFEFVVEDAVIQTGNYGPNTTTTSRAFPNEGNTTRAYIKDANSCIMMARQGGIDGNIGETAFETFQLFHHQGLARVEAYPDNKNKRVEGFVEEIITEILGANVTGMLITNIQS